MPRQKRKCLEDRPAGELAECENVLTNNCKKRDVSFLGVTEEPVAKIQRAAEDISRLTEMANEVDSKDNYGVELQSKTLSREERDELEPTVPQVFLVTCETLEPMVNSISTHIVHELHFSRSKAIESAPKLFLTELNARWKDGITKDWASLSNVENIQSEDISSFWSNEDESDDSQLSCDSDYRVNYGNPVAECKVRDVTLKLPIKFYPTDMEIESEEEESSAEDFVSDYPIACGEFPGGGIILEGERLYVISVRIVIATYDVVWVTGYKILFEPTSEEKVIDVAKDFFVNMVDSKWRGGYKSCCGDDFQLLNEHGWNKESVELFTRDDLSNNWEGDDNIAHTANKGPATLTVTKYRREGDVGVEEEILFSLPHKERLKPVSIQKSAHSVPK